MAYGEMFGPIIDGNERQSMHRFVMNIERLTQNLAAFCRSERPSGAAVLPAAHG